LDLGEAEALLDGAGRHGRSAVVVTGALAATVTTNHHRDDDHVHVAAVVVRGSTEGLSSSIRIIVTTKV
jgi:hypothetical protein